MIKTLKVSLPNTSCYAQTEIGLKEGRVVQLPNGAHFGLTGKKDGSVEVDARVNPDMVKRVNGVFRGKWRNSGNSPYAAKRLFTLVTLSVAKGLCRKSGDSSLRSE